MIRDRTTAARRTVYSLLGAGFHWIAGLNNPCLKRMLNTSILPRLLYALESLVVMDKHKEMLDVFLRDLKQIQALPRQTANEAPSIILGIPTAEAALDIRILNFFGKIISR